MNIIYSEEKILQLEKVNQINLDLNEELQTLDFAIDRFGFSLDKFALHQEDIYILAVTKDDVKKIQIVKISNDTISINTLEKTIKSDFEYRDDALNNLNMISHNNNLLIFVSKKDNTIRDDICHHSDDTIIEKIVLFENFNINNPKIIYFENKLEIENKLKDGSCFTPAKIETIGYSDCNIFPIILGCPTGYHLQEQVALLKINFETLTAIWQTTQEKEFIKYKKKHTKFETIQYKENELIFFTIGDLDRYRRHGMRGDVLLGKIEKPLFKKYKFSTLYKCEYDKKSTKLFGRTALFTSNQQYAIIRPYFTKYDPWKKREKLFDLDTNELVSVELPRGFGEHHIINGNDKYFLSFGKNSKKENLLTIFKEKLV